MQLHLQRWFLIGGSQVLLLPIAILVMMGCSFLSTNPDVAPSSFPMPTPFISTPELIEQAFANHKITDEKRLIYLAYALGDYEKLPAQYYSNIPWDGTLVALELNEAANSVDVMCKLSSFAQNELRRVLGTGILCDD